MTITNITDKERALSAENQRLNGLVDDLVAGLNSHMERAGKLYSLNQRLEEVLKMALTAIQYREGGWSQFNPVVAAIQKVLAQKEFECPRCGHCCKE